MKSVLPRARGPAAVEGARCRVREERPSDFAAVVRLQNRLDPANQTTVEEAKGFREAAARPELERHRWVAEATASGEVVAMAALEQTPFSFHPGKFWAAVKVDPDHQGRGVGRALADTLEAAAVRRRATVLWASVRADDPRSLGFFARRGFHEVRRMWLSWLELDAVRWNAFRDRTASLEGAGLRFTTLAEEGPDRPDVRRRYHALHAETGEDVPSIAPVTAVPLEQFVRFEIERPGVLPHLVLLAAAGDRYVGVTSLETLDGLPGALSVGYTGVARDWRGRGLAEELKLRSLRTARGLGYRTVRTANDSRNAPIWSINERLGFRPRQTWINGERTLPPG